MSRRDSMKDISPALQASFDRYNRAVEEASAASRHLEFARSAYFTTLEKYAKANETLAAGREN